MDRAWHIMMKLYVEFLSGFIPIRFCLALRKCCRMLCMLQEYGFIYARLDKVRYSLLVRLTNRQTVVGRFGALLQDVDWLAM